MDILYELLTLSDLDNKIASTRKYIENIKKYAPQMKAFTFLFDDQWHLPIKKDKYKGKIGYIDWILRSDELFLSLNVLYYSTGLIKSVESLTQCSALLQITDLRNVRTLSGKKFKRNYIHDKKVPVYTVLSERVVSPESFAVPESGIEKFAYRSKILSKFGLQSPLDDV
jgi:hypothetical protein